MDLDVLEKEVGVRLKKIRKSKKVTQRELAKELNVSTQQFRKYEVGLNRISAGKLQLVAKVLNVPIDAFYSDSAQYVENISGSLGIDNEAGLGVIARATHQTDEKSAILESSYHLLKAYKNITDPKAKEEILEIIASLPDV